MVLFNKVIVYIFILIVLIIGLIVCYEDYRYNKIKNKWIKIGLFLGAVINIVVLIILLLARYEVNWLDYLYLLTNFGLAFALGFILWYLKLWSGGDAKLFLLYAFLIPFSFYGIIYFKYFPALTLLINIILPIFIYLLIKMLLYPVQLGVSYLFRPKLIEKYFQNYKSKHKVNKIKIKEFIYTSLSFIIILILFQLIRAKFKNFLDPLLGNLFYVIYFFIGFLIFRPLRQFLQKKIIIALILIAIYFIGTIVYFHESIIEDFHKVFALQMIFMMLFFYIFKYGKRLGQFFYNSAEVRMIPVNDLQAGVYINKSQLNDIFKTDKDIAKFKKQVKDVLPEEEFDHLWELIKAKKDSQDRKQYKFISFFRRLSPHALPSLIRDIYQYKKNKKTEEDLIDKITKKLTNEQKDQLNLILSDNNEIKIFIKSLRGKLTREQAEKIKKMIRKRNKEIKAQGHPPVEHIILHKTFSFAPFMLLGVIITLLTKSSIIHLIYEYILHR